MTYRAAIYTHPRTGQETACTGPEHAHLPEPELIEEAVRWCREAGLIGPDEHQVDEDTCRARISVGDWQE
jgi:hypothetical protein